MSKKIIPKGNISPKILAIEEELKRLKKKGLSFHISKPIERPKNFEKWKKKNEEFIKKSQEKRNKKPANFVGWEYKDRFSYRKLS